MPILPGLVPTDIYLPARFADPARWAVVACDQFTSQPDYWQRVEERVGDAPSALKLVLPEIYLDKTEEKIKSINAAMRDYLKTGVLTKAVTDGFIITERTLKAGKRIGLMAAVDLEAYDFTPGTDKLIRATEGTIIERIPPRVKIRRDAALELPHVMLLINDSQNTVIEPLYDSVKENAPLYDFELMEDGGHLRGFALTDEKLINELSEALEALKIKQNGFLYAVGDGNHSLASAKALYEEIKARIGDKALTSPTRYALTEIVNLHSPALTFEPIHRVVFGCSADRLCAEFEKATGLPSGTDIVFTNGRGFSAGNMLPVAVLQPFLDGWLKNHPEARIDYVHGAAAVNEICRGDANTGILLNAIDKSLLFPSVLAGGVLPRKAFSMGEANEKRYYMEARLITEPSFIYE